MNHLIGTAAWLLCLSSVAFGQTDPEQAVVQLGGCSGVCVSADGLILTADHCGSENKIEVEFPDGTKHRATLVYSPPQNGVDECQAYQIDSEAGLPFVNVAKSSPEAGDAVWSVGYPFGNYQRNAGKVQRVGFTVGRDRRFEAEVADGIVTDWQSDGGNSGGPLFNGAGEVVGLLSMSSKGEPRSYWIGGKSIAIALAKRKHAVSDRRLVLFGADWCGPCKQYRDEAAATGVELVYIKESGKNFAEWKASFERHTGKKLDQYPTFWVENTAEFKQVEYRPGLLQRIVGWFGATVRGIVATFIGEQAAPDGRADIPPDPVPEESPNFDLPPTPSETFDSANITIVIAAAMQDVGAVKGAGIKIALSKAAGPLERAVNEKIGGKATLVLVPQRTQPERFAAVTSAARVTANPAAVLVLVAKQSLGLKSLIAGKVESMLVGKVPDTVPVELIFERIHGEDFAAITLALSARETHQFSRSTDSVVPSVTEDGIVAKLLPVLTSKIGDKLAESDNSLIAKLGEKLTPDTPPPEDGSDGPSPTQQSIMGGLGLLIAERMKSMWTRRKTQHAIIETEAKTT